MELRSVLVIYNAIQTIFSAWIFYEVSNSCRFWALFLVQSASLPLQYLMSGWWGHYSLKCQPVDYSTSGLAMRVNSPQGLS